MYLAKINCEDVNWTDVPQRWGFVMRVMDELSASITGKLWKFRKS